jgi:hypothetical protein
MKKSLKSAAFVLVIILGWQFNGAAQSSQYVTVTAAYPFGNKLPVQTNQVVSIVGYDWSYGGTPIYGATQDGTVINMSPHSGSNGTQIFTGLTNISVMSSSSPPNPVTGAATFQITTPACANVVSNYVPADAIVIPASATGSVQIILESSPDLVNWTAASPGTYGASAGTNRFFRVRAAAN